MRRLNARYVIKRILGAALTLWIALTVNFLLPRMMGGDPAEFMASQIAMGSPEFAQLLREQFGLDRSLPEQYFLYMSQLLRGNMGISFSQFPVPVSMLVARAIPWTLLIVVTSTLISFAIAWVLGVLAAMKKGSVYDNLVVMTFFYLQSTPFFFVGMLILMAFGFHLGWFPLSHAMPPGVAQGTPWWQLVGPVARHAFLPVFSMVLVSMAGRMVMMRSNVLQVFSEDYMVLAQAKGLHRRTILRKYALRNAMLPSFTGLMLSLGAAVGGAIAMEMIFAYPGIGLLIMNAILSQDYPLIQGCFAIIAFSVVMMNLLADFIYPFLDPRVSL